jgi:hypothetical protein
VAQPDYLNIVVQSVDADAGKSVARQVYFFEIPFDLYRLDLRARFFNFDVNLLILL